MRKFLFLIAWVDGSDSDHHNNDYHGSGTGIHKQDDLLPGWLNHNENVSSWELEAHEPNDATNEGYREAFFANFTACDSVTALYEWIDDKWQEPEDDFPED